MASNTISGASESSPYQADVIRLLRDLVNELTGITPTDYQLRTPFIELGVDSLLLIQLAKATQDLFKVTISFRDLLDRYPSLITLSAHLARTTDGSALVSSSAASSSTEYSTTGRKFEESQNSLAALHSGATGETVSPMEAIVEQQLRAFSELTRRQLAALGRGETLDTSSSAAKLPGRTNNPVPILDSVMPLARDPLEVFRLDASSDNEVVLSSGQRTYLSTFVARYCKRTAASKEHAARYRSKLADGRSSVGFRRQLKEMLYPIVGVRSRDARVWDLDGNEYVDLTMGFGVHLFGHSPQFVELALKQQLDRGIALGFQSELAGTVAEQLCQLTCQDRAVFANSGTEAVMAALRVARANTSRDLIVLFRGAYHGWSDLTQAKRQGPIDQLKSAPTALGIPKSASGEVVVLDYGTEQSLEIIRKEAHRIAAVLIEPIQSRSPLLRPIEFLINVKSICKESGAVLIFDETVTGFRLHPRGAQGILGVESDLTIYGKCIGGGMPIGVLAGKASLMDILDGGPWSFGDDTFPSREKTLFAGTFCKHPFALSACEAVLKHLISEGPDLQRRLTERTTQLVERMEASIRETEVPISIEQCGSFFLIAPPVERHAKELLLYNLIANGVYVWEGRSCFISTAHQEEDLDYAAAMFHQSLIDLADAGFLKRTPADRPLHSNALVPLTGSQLNILVASEMSAESRVAYNESLVLSFSGLARIDILRRSLMQLVRRHSILRAAVHREQEAFQIFEHVLLPSRIVNISDVAEDDREAVAGLCAGLEVDTPFSLETAPLFRILFVVIDEHRLDLVFTCHHLIMDGWSISILLRELRIIYGALSGETEIDLPPARQMSDYVKLLETQRSASNRAEGEAYWQRQRQSDMPSSELINERDMSGWMVSLEIGDTTVLALRERAKSANCTLSMYLCAVYSFFLHGTTALTDVVVGLPSAGHATGYDSVVGCCLNVLPIRTLTEDTTTFDEHLAQVRDLVVMAQQYEASIPDFTQAGPGDQKQATQLVPLFSVFNLDESNGPIEFCNLVLTPRWNWNQKSRFPLELNGTIRAGRLKLHLIARKSMFDKDCLTQALDFFAMLIDRTNRAERISISDLPRLLPTSAIIRPARIAAQTSIESQHATNGIAAADPQLRLEAQLLAFWREVLGRDDLTASQDLFDLGAHSLSAMRVASRIYDALGIEIPIIDILDARTVGELLQHVVKQLHAPTSI